MTEKQRMILPRPEVLALPPSHHGAFDYGELEKLALNPAVLLDFSVNSNPYGSPPGVYEALQRVPLDLYPDRDVLALRRALAQHLGVGMEHIEVGNGTAELIWSIALAFLRPADAVLIIGPTFDEYGRAAALMGAVVHKLDACPEQGFAVDTDAVSRRLAEVDARVVFICNPNNPTGAWTPSEAIAIWAEAHRETLFVVDEAYLEFVEGGASALPLELENLVVLRSMTKDYALAGLRLGYAVGDPTVIAALAKVRPPWSVNALAQAAGVAVLEDHAYVQKSLKRLREAKEDFTEGLRALGFAPLPSATHFFLANVRDGRAFRSALLQHKILVRDGASFGLAAYVRIATRCPEENLCFLDAVRVLKWPL